MAAFQFLILGLKNLPALELVAYDVRRQHGTEIG